MPAPDPAPEQGTLLITLSGRDRPGVTKALFGALSDETGPAAAPVEVLDVEQVVIRDRLILGALLRIGRTGPEPALVARVERLAAQLGLDVEVSGSWQEGGEPDPLRRAFRDGSRSFVTVLGAPLRPAAVAALAGRITACGANIDRIGRIAAYPVTAVELEVSGAAPDELRAALATEAADQRVDVAVERAGLHRRAKRLVVLDVDSTLIQDEVIDLLAQRAGIAGDVARVTEAAMRGELDFAASLRSRVGLLAGLPESVLDDVRLAVRLTPGARTLVRTLKRLDYRCAVVSGGFTQVIAPLVAELGIDYAAANQLEIVDGRITGRLVGPVVDRAGKAAALERFAAQAGVPLAQTVAIGDGANDLDMIARAGLGVAFNAKPVVRAAADTAVTVPYLDAILYLLGIPREEIEAADAQAATEDAPAPGVAALPA